MLGVDLRTDTERDMCLKILDYVFNSINILGSVININGGGQGGLGYMTT